MVRTLPEAEPFVLAGGAALILQGRTSRVTEDLDFFARSPDEVDAFLPRLEEALLETGLAVERRQVGVGFARLEVSGEGQSCQVDLGYDYRLMPAEDSPLGPILSAEELAADKVLAVHGRAAARDYLDRTPWSDSSGSCGRWNGREKRPQASVAPSLPSA